MSWIQQLYETYENCRSMIGHIPNDNDVPLLPICHTTQKAHIEVVIDKNGNFKRARVIPKNEARTIIPCTEESGGRTSGEAPHPLCDKLQYVAKDYLECGGSKKAYFAKYISKLECWCQSEFSHEKAMAVHCYVKKGRVIRDLIEHRVMIAQNNGKILPKWDKKKDEDTPKIFEVLGTQDQDEAFIRWMVETPGEPESRVWRDNSLWDKWIRYYSNTKEDVALCYVTGRNDLIASQHPAKIRNDGDKAKLISSNDASGFTYRGRFITSEHAASVGFETTQKAHNTLRWLIGRQGFRRGDLAIVAWAVSGVDIPKPTDDSMAILLEDMPTDELVANTAQGLAIRLRNKISGYNQVLGDTTKVVVMGLDSATPGRMAITYYRELTGSDFLERLDDWHISCAWTHRYRKVEYADKNSGKKITKYIPFIGAPAPDDIAEAAYGKRIDEKLRKVTTLRLLPCIIDGQPIPRDLVESSVRRACNRVGMEGWEWNKTLTIACALYRKYNRKENYDMTLDPNRKTRDYLYGRLLALAESIEEWALSQSGEDRQTSAARLMQRFAEHPFSTWRTIELALIPYKARLGGKSIKRQRMIDGVIASFNDGDFLNDKRLSGEFLLGYHCQREFLRAKPDKSDDTETGDSDQ